MTYNKFYSLVEEFDEFYSQFIFMENKDMTLKEFWALLFKCELRVSQISSEPRRNQGKLIAEIIKDELAKVGKV